MSIHIRDKKKIPEIFRGRRRILKHEWSFQLEPMTWHFSTSHNRRNPRRRVRTPEAESHVKTVRGKSGREAPYFELCLFETKNPTTFKGSSSAAVELCNAHVTKI